MNKAAEQRQTPAAGNTTADDQAEWLGSSCGVWGFWDGITYGALVGRNGAKWLTGMFLVFTC